MSRYAVHVVALWALVLNLVFITPAFAQRVGAVGPGCEFQQIQVAIDNHVDEIHVMTGTYQPFDATGKVIEIRGGYPSCNAPVATPGAMSTISGAGRTQTSVVKVRSGSNNNTILNLHDLEISSGNAFNGSNGNGGGISFDGHGELDLTHVNVIYNYADNGGGIDVDPDGPAAGSGFPDGQTVVFLSGSYIANNATAFDGAGVRIQGRTRLEIQKDVLSDTMSIAYNIAGVDPQGHVNHDPDTSTGGGLLVIGDRAAADISASSSATGSSLFLYNEAAYGGGIAAKSQGRVRIFTKVPSELVVIRSNTARRTGGGIFMEDFGSTVCAFGYDIESNKALNGAAIYADSGTNGAQFFYEDIDGSNLCSILVGPASGHVYPAIPNLIEGNNSMQDDGAIVLVQNPAGGINLFRAEYLKFQYNSGGTALQTFDQRTMGTMENCLIANNSFRQELIHSNGELLIDSCTVTNNSIGTDVVVNTGATTLQRSIFWQPSKRTLNQIGGARVVLSDSILNDADLYPPDQYNAINLRSDDPLFVDLSAFRENYRLSFNSPAVDYATTGLDFDLDHASRGIVKRNANAHFDIGAFERQTSITFPSYESFEEMASPEHPIGTLPENWLVNFSGSGAGWSIRARPDAGGLAAFTGDPVSAGTSSLMTPVFRLYTDSVVEFDQYVSLENTFDGAVLEIAMDGGQFFDITGVGGTFTQGGYDAQLHQSIGNPLSSRQAWTGESGGYEHVRVALHLPSAENGRQVQLRWRVGTDEVQFCDANTCLGYSIDNIAAGSSPLTDRIFVNGFDPLP